MSLFNSERYTKPGKGVEKNEKQKPAFVRFFITFWNKRFKILGVNALFVLFNLVALALLWLCFTGAVSFYNSFNGGSEFLAKVSAGAAAETNIYNGALLFVLIFFTCVPVFAIGPIRAGFTYVIKCFYKEEPCFVWNDFITKSRSNVSLSTKYSIISAIVGFLVAMSFSANMVITSPSRGMPFAICFVEWAITLFFLVLASMMSLFAYPMMVTFNVNLRQLLKNSFILVTVKWFPSLLILLLDAAIIIVPIVLIPVANYIMFSLMVVLYATFIPGIIGLINMFYVYPILKKYLIDNPNADKSEKDDGGEEVPAGENAESGHFENGMWING